MLRCNGGDTSPLWLAAKAGPRPTGLSLRENMENRLYEEKQMTASSLSMTGASSARDRAWSQTDRQQSQSQGRRLQMRIAKVVQQHNDAGGCWVM